MVLNTNTRASDLENIKVSFEHFNKCNAGTMRYSSFNAQLLQSSQEGYAVKVPFLYTINLPSGERRDGELQKGWSSHFLSSRAVSPCAKEARLGEHVGVHYYAKRQMVQLPPWSPNGKRPKGLLGVHICQCLVQVYSKPLFHSTSENFQVGSFYRVVRHQHKIFSWESNFLLHFIAAQVKKWL